MRSNDDPVDGDLLPADEVRLGGGTGSGPQNWRPHSVSALGRLNRWRFAAAWLLLALMGGCLWWMLSWLQPQSPARLSLIGSSYRENLSVKHNVFGWRFLEDMAAFAKSDQSRSIYTGATWHLKSAPLVLTSDSKWDAGWDDLNEETLVVCVCAHGAADQNGAYLLPEDCDPNQPEHRVRVADMINRLGELPAEKKKLLIFDAAQFDANWQHGVFHNEFAEALRQLNDSIVAIPNLVVICSSDQNQRSWDGLPFQRTVFGHFLMRGFRGAAADQDQDGRIDAWDLHRYVSDNVQHWVAANRQSIQEPLLLPVGEAGRDRSYHIDLGILEKDNASTPPMTIAAFKDARRLTKAWTLYHRLAESTPAPYTHAPGHWREYEQTLLRFESLLAVNDQQGANQLQERLEAIQYQLEWERQQTLAVNQTNLFLGAAIAGSEADQTQAQQVIDDLWAAKPSARDSVWQRVVSKAGDDSLAQGQLRLQVLRLLYDRALADPIDALDLTAELSHVIVDPLVPAPSEINFLQMLARHYPEDGRTLDEMTRVGTALRLRSMASKASVSYHDNGESHCEEVLPWIEKEIRDGNQQRRLGEDLLFAEKEDRKKADVHFAAARKAYKMAIRRGKRISAAVSLRDRVFAEAPDYIEWIASVSDIENESRRPNTWLPRFEKLMSATHDLNRQLTVIPTEDESHSKSQSAQNSRDALVETMERVSRHFSAIQKDFDRWWHLQADPETPDTWTGTELALAVPYGEPEIRVSLIIGQQQLAQKTAQSKVSQNDDLIALPKRSDAELAQSHTTQEHLSMQRAIVQGRLALALMGNSVYDQLAQFGSETFDQTSHRLDVLPTDPNWQKSVNKAAAEVAGRLSSHQTEIVSTSTNRTTSTSLASEFNRQLGGLGADAPKVSPNILRRNQLQSNLFLELARQAMLDHWHDGASGDPYYVRSARSCWQSARRLWPENKQLATLSDHLEAPVDLKLAAPKRLDLTTEPQLPFQIGVTRSPHAMLPEGFPLLWIEADPTLTLERPVTGQRLVQKLVSDENPSFEACYLLNPDRTDGQAERADQNSSRVPAITVSSRRSSTGGNLKRNGKQQIEVIGFFRGMQMQQLVEVVDHSRPEIAATEFRRPREAMLSVRASQDLHGIYGKGSGAVAIVLDASGSMGSPVGKRFDRSAKYFEATRALKTVLEKLPDGVKVSIWVLGQAVGPAKTVRHAEQTIRRVTGPVTWTTTDRGLVDAIMQEIQYPNIEPWNESPLIEAMLAARQDLIGASGFRTMLVLTDGMDNRYANTHGLTGPAASVQALKTAFDKSGITLNIVGFKVEAGEEKQARDQFRTIEKFSPPGKYFEVKDATVLAKTLNAVLHQRVRYWVDDYSSEELTGERVTMEAGMGDKDDHWYPHPLPAGSYALWNNVNSNPTRLLLQRGDRMIVQFERSSGQLKGERLPYLATEYSWKPTKTQQGWSVTALENRLGKQDQLQMLVGLEKLPGDNASAIQQVEPHDVWFDIADQNGNPLPGTLAWNRTYGFPVPTYQLETDHGAIRPRQQQSTRPVVNVWFTPERQTPAAIRFEQGRDYQQLGELVGKEIDIDGVNVNVESADVEERMVETSPGKMERQSCLVVRISHSSPEALWVRPTGVEFEGKQNLYFKQIGKYTGVFWPLAADQINQAVTGLELVSVSDLKRQATLKGYQIKLDNLPAPTADDVVFPPLASDLD